MNQYAVRFAFSGVALSMFSGCASIVGGTTQTLTVETRHKGQMVASASCEMLNDKGKWYVTSPGSTIVNKSYGDLSVKCEKDKYDPGLATVRSSSSMVWGNILFGGPIGWAVDAGRGAGYDYPTLIQIEMGQSIEIGRPPEQTQSAPQSTP